MNRNDSLKEMIQNGLIDQAIVLVKDAKDHLEGEAFAQTVLRNEKATPELVETVLEAFLNTRQNRMGEHHPWVHSLSHFTKILWGQRLDGWIKKFNKISFNGANELNDPNCSDRLVDDFANYAKWNDDPADFFLILSNLTWMDWKYYGYAKARIEAGRFDSEEAFLRWKLTQPGAYMERDNEVLRELVCVVKIRAHIQRLEELDVDTSEFSNLERDLLTTQLHELELKLQAETSNFLRRRLELGIQKTSVALASLNESNQ